MTALGVDLGDRRIGLAVSDPNGVVAVGAGAALVGSEREAVAAIAAAARERDVDVVVVGLPVTMRGTRSARTMKTERFVLHLQQALDIPVVLWDERLTTVAAERALRSTREEGAPRTRAKRRVGRVDEVAATLLLQSWLDARREGRGPALAADSDGDASRSDP